MEEDRKSGEQPMAEKTKPKGGNSWIIWVVGCLVVLVMVVAVGGYFIWKAGSALTTNLDEYADEFGERLEDEFEDVMMEAVEDAVKESGEDIDFEQLNQMIEAGDWEAIEEMGKDLEKVEQ